jgi:hypothetical protein
MKITMISPIMNATARYLHANCVWNAINESMLQNCQICMIQNGNPYDYAVAEHVDEIIKDEFYCDESIKNYEIALV